MANENDTLKSQGNWDKEAIAANIATGAVAGVAAGAAVYLGKVAYEVWKSDWAKEKAVEGVATLARSFFK